MADETAAAMPIVDIEAAPAETASAVVDEGCPADATMADESEGPLTGAASAVADELRQADSTMANETGAPPAEVASAAVDQTQADPTTGGNGSGEEKAPTEGTVTGDEKAVLPAATNASNGDASEDTPALQTDQRVSDNFAAPPAIKNDDGATVAFGTDTRYLLYCGRRANDSRCGPASGPQCASCLRLQKDPSKRWELLAMMFPSLGSRDFVSALRRSGGSWMEAAHGLRQQGIPSLSNEIAFPPHPRSGEGPAVAVNPNHLISVLEILGYVEPPAAQAALRRSEHNVEAALSYLLDTPPETLANAVAEDEQRTAAFEAVQAERKAARVQAYKDVLQQKVSLDLKEGKWSKSNTTAEAQGHSMQMTMEAKPEEGEGKPIFCVVCADEAHSICRNCAVCADCIDSQQIIFNCPKMANGAHVHVHPLNLIEPGVRNKNCRVRGDGCKGGLHNGSDRGSVGWTCSHSECDFNVCISCMAKEAPAGYLRRYGRQVTLIAAAQEQVGVPAAEKDVAATASQTTAPTQEVAAEEAEGELGEHEATALEEESERPHGSNGISEGAGASLFELIAAERFSAAAWEGLPLEPSAVEAVVGTGQVGTTTPLQQSPRPQRVLESVDPNRNQQESALTEESQKALQELISGSRARSKILTSCETELMEDILRRAELLGRDRPTLRMLRSVVKAGNVAIAAALLLAKDFAPTTSKRKRQDCDSNTSDEDANAPRCFCGDIIEFRGAVGCLNGHLMHPDCASDLMMGGSSCPTCREPLFFPHVADKEAKSAVYHFSRLVRGQQHKVEEKIKSEFNNLLSSGDYSFLRAGDIVRISPNVDVCASEMMKSPSNTGWCSDLEECCGVMGSITEVVKNKEGNKETVVAVKVKTTALGHLLAREDDGGFRCSKCDKRYTHNNDNNSEEATREDTTCAHCTHCKLCKHCCEGDKNCATNAAEWLWNPSLLTLVSRASGAALFDPSLATKDAIKAQEAEGFILRLRAELKAVSAARAKVNQELEHLLQWPSITSTVNIPKESEDALKAVAKDLLPADQQRAQHLLALAHQWGDSSKDLVSIQKLLQETIKAGDIDSAARFVRRHNAGLVTDALYWADAMAQKREYKVESFCQVNLVAWPSNNAPMTGYKLKPGARFDSKQEWMDKTGLLWLQVDETSFPDFGEHEGRVVANKGDSKLTAAMVGASVVRGQDWNDDHRDGGLGSVGIVMSVKEGRVVVHWSSCNSIREHKAGVDGKFELKYACLAPPPQGWLCMRPGGTDSQAIVAPGRIPLRCFCCGDWLYHPSTPKKSFHVVKGEDKLCKGKELLVAATLMPVKVVSTESGKIQCAFDGVAGPSGANSAISYYPRDLVYPKIKEGDVTDNSDDTIFLNGNWRTRRELVLLLGNEADAKAAWASAKGTSEDANQVGFPSCLKGHLLHGRCFQGAILSGQSCPAPGCNEPLWQPQVRLLRSSDGACCGQSGTERMAVDGEELSRQMANARPSHEAAVEANNIRSAVGGEIELKMCPCCFAGPLYNIECEDMARHHGQCSTAALSSSGCGYSATRAEISSALAQMTATQTVADVLPKCPTHKRGVMFNGCMSCGHLFTGIYWPSMPKWDANAQAFISLETKKRQMASILAREIRREAGMLQYERHALQVAKAGTKHYNQPGGFLQCLPCLPPPSDLFPIGCGANCNLSHRDDGNCLVCGQSWRNHHNGHACHDGHRGQWVLQDW